MTSAEAKKSRGKSRDYYLMTKSQRWLKQREPTRREYLYVLANPWTRAKCMRGSGIIAWRVPQGTVSGPSL